MAVITISRELGSGGPQIGRATAEKLGYHYVDKTTIHNVFHQYGFTPFDKIYESPTSFWDRFDNMRSRTLENLNHVIQALARHGNCVILGRGSYAVLAGLADVLHVRLQAAFPVRLRRFMDMEGVTDQNQAENMLIEGGSLRSSFVESTYQVPWDAAGQFDLVLSTDKVPPDLCVRIICLAVEALTAAGPSSGDAPCARDLDVDPFLESAVWAALGCREAH